MEIGSEMQLNLSEYDGVCEDNIFEYLNEFETLYLDSGRSAIYVLSRSLPKGKVIVPSYICKSVIDSFVDREMAFYDLNMDFSINKESIYECLEAEKPRILFMMNYWGRGVYSSVQEDLKQYCGKNDIIIIEDTTHSIFSNNNAIGDYCVCSIRKWAPFPVGGILYSKSRLPALCCEVKKGVSESKMIGMLLKQLYINDHSYKCNSIYRKIFNDDNERLQKQECAYYLPAFSRFVMERTSVNKIRNIRMKNAKLLEEYLLYSNVKPIIHFEANQVPFTYPVLVDRRDELRTFLSRNGVFCAIHWPLEEHKQLNEINKYINNHIISLNIDQRYCELHMKRITELIDSFMQR